MFKSAKFSKPKNSVLKRKNQDFTLHCAGAAFANYPVRHKTVFSWSNYMDRRLLGRRGLTLEYYGDDFWAVTAVTKNINEFTPPTGIEHLMTSEGHQMVREDGLFGSST